MANTRRYVVRYVSVMTRGGKVAEKKTISLTMDEDTKNSKVGDSASSMGLTTIGRDVVYKRSHEPT